MSQSIHYENYFGSVILTPVTQYMPIQSVSMEKMPATTHANLISIEGAEKLALITDNKDIQVAFTPDLKQAYVLHHKGPSTVAIVKIEHLTYLGDTPAKEIEDAYKQSPEYCSAVSGLSFGQQSISNNLGV